MIGSAAIAVLIDARLAAHGLSGGGVPETPMGGTLPPQVHAAFSQAMGEATYLLPAALVVSIVAALFFERPRHFGPRSGTGESAGATR